MNEGVTITPDLKAGLWDAIQSLASAPRPERTLTGLTLMLQDETLKAALHPFTLEGAHGRLLDADHETLNFADTVCFEMEDLDAHERRGGTGHHLPIPPAGARFDGRPTLLILDEAWLFLDDPMFAARMVRSGSKPFARRTCPSCSRPSLWLNIAGSTIAPALVESSPDTHLPAE